MKAKLLILTMLVFCGVGFGQKSYILDKNGDTLWVIPIKQIKENKMYYLEIGNDVISNFPDLELLDKTKYESKESAIDSLYSVINKSFENKLDKNLFWWNMFNGYDRLKYGKPETDFIEINHKIYGCHIYLSNQINEQ